MLESISFKEIVRHLGKFDDRYYLGDILEG